MKNIAVIIESSTQFGRNLLSGIAKYGQMHDWNLHFEERGLKTTEPGWLEHWKGDGIIVRSLDQTISRAKSREGIPVLNLCAEGEQAFVAGMLINSDHLAVGALAADYFIGKGYERFAYIGYENRHYSTFRQEGYISKLEQRGYECCSLEVPPIPDGDYQSRSRQIRQFLDDLVMPCAVFCACDAVAVGVINLCHELGKAVPEQLAVLGVDDDSLLCSMVFPSLSSIDPDIPRVGWLAASWLGAMMEGKDPHGMGIQRVVAPRGVTERLSSGVCAVSDPIVAKALEQIRLRATEGARVKDIANQCHVSQRLLERSFEKEMGVTVKRLLIETQLERIKGWLKDTDFTLAHIAELAGMKYPERLSHMFKRETGMTPGQFRGQHRT
ncbi:DNA-binding transcriptional regulator [Verrucomicrobiaceae bacterium N1E253]|uniref:DNA-binding transcriptional regulator n=1 Tax=Oceaniferula marina TaxID=2748318 RepID=A0A851GL84_9BACT|nr:DNA-binding transcriptional regulator [Oceaniferula marina]NWK55935.1 DNA-binding transcriptional regulator [Oceaniferula marina]